MLTRPNQHQAGLLYAYPIQNYSSFPIFLFHQPPSNLSSRNQTKSIPRHSSLKSGFSRSLHQLQHPPFQDSWVTAMMNQLLQPLTSHRPQLAPFRQLPFSNSLLSGSNASSHLSRPFSTQKPPPPPPHQNPSFGSASFKDLGANRTVKIVVYVSLGIIATVESITWGKLIYRRFGPDPKEGEE